MSRSAHVPCGPPKRGASSGYRRALVSAASAASTTMLYGSAGMGPTSAMVGQPARPPRSCLAGQSSAQRGLMPGAVRCADVERRARAADAEETGNFELGRRAATAVAGLGFGAAAALQRVARAKTAPSTVTAALTVEKSPLDNRQYKAQTLANGLRVLLVSDPDSDRAAAALDVHSGFFQDPDSLPGLAHFCEHMLFLGTKDFPDENSFDQYLAANSGSSNAYTDHEDTCFFFGCRPEAITGALQRFGSFFTAPLFTPSATERELNAINSEHLKNLQSDGFRFSQLLSSRSNPEHPYYHFGTGNTATLKDNPKQMGLDIRQELLVYWERFFRAPLMTLCIVGREDLRTLEGYAKRYFGGIRGAGPEGVVDPARAWKNTSPFLDGAFGKVVEVVPISDARSLQLIFPLRFNDDGTSDPASGPSVSSEAWRKYKPYEYLGAVVGYEGNGSLCAMLRRRSWVTALSAGLVEENSSFALINIGIEMTSEGLSHRDDIIELFFGYLNLLRGLKEWPQELIEENVVLSEASWRCAEKQQPDGAVVQLASNMQRYVNPEQYISGSQLLRRGPEIQELLKTTLAALMPRNCLTAAISRSYESVASETERWYGTRYRLQPLDAQIRRWEAATPAPGLAVPKPNPFLPRSLELKAPRTPFPPLGVAPPAPMERRRDNLWHLFFRQDTEFGVPKAYAFIELVTPYPKSSARNFVLGRLYEALVEDALTESLLYDASVAGLVFKVATTARGIQLFFGGYDDRLIEFATTCLQRVRDFKPPDDVARFEAQRDVIMRDYESLATQQPFQQGAYWSRLATSTPNFAVAELLDVVNAIRINDLIDFSAQLVQEPKYGYALCQGNLLGEEADRLVAAVESTLPFAPLQAGASPDPEIVQLPVKPVGPGCAILHDAFDAGEENSSVTVVYQTGSARAADGIEGRRMWASVTVLGSLLRDRFYSELRTKQQLGYIVTSTTDRREGVVRLVFVVQGTVLGPMGMLDRIDAFLAGIRVMLGERGPAEVREQAASLAESRLARAQQLSESVDRTFQEVASREFQWNRNVLEAEELRRVTFSDVLEAFDRYVAVGGNQRRRLVSMIFGSVHKNEKRGAEEALEAQGALLIKDEEAFMANTKKWPTKIGSSR